MIAPLSPDAPAGAPGEAAAGRTDRPTSGGTLPATVDGTWPATGPFSAYEGPAGVLVLHGLTATVATVRPLADAFADAGFSVEAPLLPGHGTNPEDLEATGFADWRRAAEEAFESLRARSEPTVVAGHSLGGTLALSLVAEHPEIAGLVLVNPFVEPPAGSALEMLRAARRAGRRQLPAIAGDVAKPGVVEPAYDTVPVAALLSLFEAAGELAPRLGALSCPVLLMTSRVDHVVPPSHSDFLAGALVAPVERVVLEHSYHVATLDHDAGEIEERAVGFAQKCCA